MAPRIAKSLERLRAQINAAYPDRSKVSDGWIGDTKHAARASDHNPNAAGVVQALDITHDPAHGFDSWRFADMLRQSEDPRLKYVISNGRIFSSSTSPWVWRKYTGANAHAHHVHISVSDDHELYDDAAPWSLTATGLPAPRPPPVVVPGITDAVRRSMAKKIIGYEAKRDLNGNLDVHSPGDGSHEIAGISSTSNLSTYQNLLALLRSGKYTEAEREAEKFVIEYTRAGAEWATDAGVEFYLRDCIFNRGPKAGAIILQKALGVIEDGEVGPTTRAARDQVAPDVLLTRLRTAREQYEIDKYGRRERYWVGLVRRWDRALTDAHAFRSAMPAPRPPVPGPSGAQKGFAAAVLAMLAGIAGWFADHWLPVVLVLVMGIAGGLIVWKIKRNRE